LGNNANLLHKPANPGPLGLNCFAVTTFLLSLVNAGIIGNEAAGHVWLTLALVFGGVVQVLAGMWEFKTQNVFAATAFSSYGGFWIALGLVPVFVCKGIIADTEVSTTLLGWFLVAFTIFTFYMWIASFKTNRALAVVFTMLLITFVLLDIGHLVNPVFNIAGGYFGIITAFCAWYTSAAGVLNEVYGKVILPV
jgi:succinate-acetate transporter protein